jgi:hypothetical protein
LLEIAAWVDILIMVAVFRRPVPIIEIYSKTVRMFILKMGEES